MLSPDEFTVGALCDAQPLSLLLPRTKYEERVLIAGTAEERFAIFIGEQHRFSSFECNTADRWKGLLIPNVSVELDESTVFDPASQGVPYGALVREDHTLMMAVEGRHQHGFAHQIFVPLLTGLPPTRAETKAGFTSWRVVLGAGEHKRILAEIKVEPRN